MWSDTIEKFNIDKSELRRVRSDLDKYFIPLSGNEELIKLDTIFFLELSDNVDFEVNQIEGTEKIRYLLNNVYRSDFLLGMKSREISYLKLHAQIAENVRCFVLKRTKNSDIHEVIQKIRTIINQ
ncbi:MAG: hypothetical protein HRT57_03235 [Crocinitomicaceae bacterium]|nr:hypothetical protein [Crocinitomicaceae bacterium]